MSALAAAGALAVYVHFCGYRVLPWVCMAVNFGLGAPKYTDGGVSLKHAHSGRVSHGGRGWCLTLMQLQKPGQVVGAGPSLWQGGKWRVEKGTQASVICELKNL